MGKNSETRGRQSERIKKATAPLRQTARLRAMLDKREFLELPAVYDPLTARIAEEAGFRTLYNGGFVTGSFSGISEPLLTMTEQIGAAANIAAQVKVPPRGVDVAGVVAVHGREAAVRAPHPAALGTHAHPHPTVGDLDVADGGFR